MNLKESCMLYMQVTYLNNKYSSMVSELRKRYGTRGTLIQVLHGTRNEFTLANRGVEGGQNDHEAIEGQRFNLVRNIVGSISGITKIQTMRVLRALGIDSPESDNRISIRELEEDDIPVVAEIYRRVTMNPRDLQSYAENGGIFQPLNEKRLTEAYQKPHHLHYVMEWEGKVIAGFDLLLPPDIITRFEDYAGTPFDSEYRKHLAPEHQQFIEGHSDEIVWLHDYIVNPGNRDFAAGSLFIKHICRKVHNEFGVPYAMGEIWSASYPGDPTSITINRPSRMVVEIILGGQNIGHVPLDITVDGVKLKIQRCVYLFNLEELARQGKI